MHNTWLPYHIVQLHFSFSYRITFSFLLYFISSALCFFSLYISWTYIWIFIELSCKLTRMTHISIYMNLNILKLIFFKRIDDFHYELKFLSEFFSTAKPLYIQICALSNFQTKPTIQTSQKIPNSYKNRPKNHQTYSTLQRLKKYRNTKIQLSKSRTKKIKCDL